MTKLFLTDLATESITEDVGNAAEEAIKTTNVFITYLKGQVPVLLHFVEMLILALIVFWIGKSVIRFVLKLLDRSFEKAGLEESVIRFLHSLLKTALYVLLVFMMAGIIGVGTSSIIALVGSAGLTIGLALQGSLSNFAGGVLILLLKPFKIGDTIEVTGCMGTVTEIDIFYTKLLTLDNKRIVIPNGILSNSNITNITAEPERVLDMEFPVDYSVDIKEVRGVLEYIAENAELVDKEKDVQIFVSRFDDSAITMGFRVWVATADYFALKCDIMEQVKSEFDKRGISIPYNQLEVKMVGQ